MWLQLLFLALSFYKCKAAIYHLNESEYDRMPPVFHLDPYESCVEEGGRYCSVEFNLVSEAPSKLFTMIQEYSAHKPTHFNHSHLQYGICATKTCKHFQTYTNLDQKAILEECLNESMWRNYKLETKVIEITCNDAITNKFNEIDTVDVIVAVVCVSLLLLNVVGSLQEFWIEKSGQGNEFLSCFSLPRNWKILVANSKPKDPRVAALRGFYGIRALSMVLVIGTHAMLPFVVSSSNTQEWEETYMVFKYVGNGTLVVQTFFVLSGFLLAHNLQLYSERVKVTVYMLPKKILLRWLRLAPPYLFVLAITATWLRFTGPGPLWRTTIGRSVSDCRRDWWLVLLYATNYIDNSQCMAETWYLAADMQLTILGLIVYVLTKGRVRTAVLTLLVVAGTVAPAAHTYLQDLDAAVLLAPEVGRNFFVADPTFNHVYKRGHTNLPSYVMGMAAGLLVYHWQKTDFDIKKYPKFRYVFWLMFPVGVATLFTGSVFYDDSPRASIHLRAFWAALNKVIFGLIAAPLTVGLAFKVDRLYRGILSWRGWLPPARLSYCAYILHVFLIRIYTSTRTTLVHVSHGNTVATLTVIVLVSFLMAIPLWLLVEAPVTNVIKLLVIRTGLLPKDITEKSNGQITNDPGVTSTGGHINIAFITKL